MIIVLFSPYFICVSVCVGMGRCLVLHTIGTTIHVMCASRVHCDVYGCMDARTYACVCVCVRARVIFRVYKNDFAQKAQSNLLPITMCCV